MAFGPDLVTKRTRESTSKVRTGCSTCKARRVKCDETKPTCRRCGIGGRRCEYNIARAARPPRDVITVYLPPAQDQPVFFVKDRGVDFFHHNIAAKLDGQFDSQFWSKLVLQLSHSEPSIRHAVSAVSAIYQDVESSLRHSVCYFKANPQTQLEWDTAVRSLSARIQAHPNSNLVPLVCCLLFTCIEFLRGSVESSMLHIHSGFNILAALRHNSNEMPDLKSYHSPNELETIEDYIVPMFSRLNVLCSLRGRMTPPIYTARVQDNSYQEDPTESRRRLYEISDSCIRFIAKASLKAAMFQIDVDDLIEQVKLQRRLDTWCDQLGKLLERMQIAGSPKKQNALNLLLVHYKVIYIWTRVCTTAGEMATDSYHTDFEELVHYAEQVAQPGVGVATPQPMSFDMQTLGPLYYTALKCRHPTIRRRALQTLQLAPRRDGLWNAHHAYVTAKRVIELEERHLNGQELPDEIVRIHGLVLPEEESQIYAGTLEAVFQTKPLGLLGEWHTFTEYIKL